MLIVDMYVFMAETTAHWSVVPKSCIDSMPRR